MRTRRAAWAAGGIILVAVLGALAWGLLHPARQAAGVVGGLAPETVVRTLDGEDIRLSDLRGTPVVINFWASWCSSCRQEAAVLRRAAAGTAGRVRFLGVDILDTDAAARAYAAGSPGNYPVGPALVGGMAAFGVVAPPETFFLDSGGRVLGRVSGPIDDVTLAQYIRRLTS